ncbi:MAG TPA: hypothetical protein VFG42_08205 [Baekduia sp.]|uniref:hypothetical protein n=1 Tax=Baekduia sp. TaxID=2600305 RepID=UPI002D792764|nr:hypothetical protein [Baekduia sp.]HET6506757.1 hypothetical protein [Baekduia sp.]
MEATTSSPDWFSSDPVQAAVCTEFTQEATGSWVWLYRQRGDVRAHSIGQYSALLSPDRVERGIGGPGWDVHIGDGGFGFTEYYEDGGKRTVYERHPDNGVELLVVYRDFHGVRPSELELVEEFRLLFNLWEDRPTRSYYYFDDSGNPVKAVTITDEGVRALTSLVRRYQAAKQMHLALYIDSTLRSDELPATEESWDVADDAGVLSYYRGQLSLGDGMFSRFDGKRLLAPPPVEASGIYPYEKARQYETFLIGETPEGEPMRFASDPAQLANYFGANPDSPHYLTPVYFRREVLNKYYADTDRYTVEDGHLRCAGLWGLRLDNDQAGHVMVFLGDLGRDIPQQEAQYWLSFNILPPEEGPSETLVRRAFGGQFADPKSLDLRFPRAYREADKAWAAAFGAPLFQPLHDDDRHILSKLHVPVGDSAAEFDEQVLYLAKLVVDSLNEAAIEALTGKGDKKDEKGLAKLERLLDAKGIPDARGVLRPFANVQGLRSRGAAHRKATSFDITEAIGDLGRQEGFEKLLADAMGTLQALKQFAEQQSPLDDSDGGQSS